MSGAILSPPSVLRFGKYRGLPVGAVIGFDPGYVAWIRDTSTAYRLADSTAALLRVAVAEQREQSLRRQNAWAWGCGAGAKASADRRRGKVIELEHKARRAAGQVTCMCFPNAWKHCPHCHGAGWTIPHPTATEERRNG